MNSYDKEEARLDKIAEGGYIDRINQSMIEYTSRVFMRHMGNGSVLEMGPAEGRMTDIISDQFEKYEIVDGTDVFFDDIKTKHPSIVCHHSLFETFEPEKQYDYIIMSHVLEHVENPVDVLVKCKTWLKTGGGRILAAVPNSNSLHRQIGVKLGLIDDTKSLHEGDIRIGHRRVYDMDSFVKDFETAGFCIKKKGGYWLKPLSNKQIESTWTDDLIDAFMQMGEQYPDIACNIYLVAKV